MILALAVIVSSHFCWFTLGFLAMIFVLAMREWWLWWHKAKER